jgi:hypothetical protein
MQSLVQAVLFAICVAAAAEHRALHISRFPMLLLILGAVVAFHEALLDNEE